MALPREAEALTEAHRLAQLAVRAGAVRDLLRVWPLYDLRRIAASWPAVEDALVRVIQAHGRTSDGLAGAFFRRFRAAMGVTGPHPVLRDVPEQEIRDGLLYVAAVRPAQQLSRARPVEQVAQSALTNTAGEVARHTLNFGRLTLLDSAAADPQALGWARVTSGQPCGFCAMLASRGPVYKANTVDFRAHGGCACSAIPVYRPDDWPARSKRFSDVWDDTTRGLSGRDARLSFRHAIEGR